MDFLEHALKMGLVPVLFVAPSAESHEVFYAVGILGASHSPGIDVVDVYGLGVAYLARYPVRDVVPKGLEVNFSVFLHPVGRNAHRYFRSAR